MKKRTSFVFVFVAICMLLSTGILASAAQMSTYATTNYNKSWYYATDTGGYGSRVGPNAKTTSNSIWIRNTGGPDCTARAMGYKNDQYTIYTPTQYLPLGAEVSFLGSTIYSNGMQAAVRLDLIAPNQHNQNAVGQWNPN